MSRQTRRPPWGATKKQGQAFANERKLKNRIHELTLELGRARGEIETLTETNVSLNLRVNELSVQVAALPDPTKVTNEIAMRVMAQLFLALSTGKVQL